MTLHNEDELITLAKAGDQEAFAKLLTPHLPMLVAYCWAICKDYHVAEDVVQQTAMVAYRKLALFFPEADFVSWLKAIARREALNARKKLGRRREIAADTFLEAAFDDPRPDAVAPERDALRKCLELLNDGNQRSALVVRSYYFDGSTVAEIASEMEMNLNTVKTLLRRARLTLQDCIERRIQREVDI